MVRVRLRVTLSLTVSVAVLVTLVFALTLAVVIVVTDAFMVNVADMVSLETPPKATNHPRSMPIPPGPWSLVLVSSLCYRLPWFNGLRLDVGKGRVVAHRHGHLVHPCRTCRGCDLGSVLNAGVRTIDPRFVFICKA